MKSNLIKILIFLVIFFTLIISVTATTQTWTCSSGLGCSFGSKCGGVNSILLHDSYGTYTYTFSSSTTGQHSCTVTTNTFAYGYLNWDFQDKETTNVWINDNLILTTSDYACNDINQKDCEECSDHTTIGTNSNVPIDSSNTLKLRGQQSHYLDYIKIECDPSGNECTSGETNTDSCGPSEEGECSYGTKTQICNSQGDWGAWSVCQGAVYPETETCDGKDNDCDGQTDEGCISECTPSETETQQCGTTNTGECSYGTETKTCNSNGQWSNWQGCDSVEPETETCDYIDNDCDGETDEECVFECNDNDDNDHDGLTDDDDPGCYNSANVYNPYDDDESDATTECQDGIDNDNDGVKDRDDPGCYTDKGIYNPLDDDESDATTECQDGIDNDDDGLIDDDDPDCSSPQDDSEEEHKSCDKLNIREVIYEDTVKPGEYLSLDIHVKSCYDTDFRTIISSEDVDIFQTFKSLHMSVDIPNDIKPGEYEFKITVYQNNRHDSAYRTFKIKGEQKDTSPTQNTVTRYVLQDSIIKEKDTSQMTKQFKENPNFYMSGLKGLALGLSFMLAILTIFVVILRVRNN